MAADEPAYADDPSILNTEFVLRRIPPRHYVKKTGTNEWVVSSAAFDNDKSDGTPMSTARENLVPDMHRYLRPFTGYGLARLSVGVARNPLKQRVTQEPREPAEPEHTWVAGEKTKKTMRAMRDAAPLIAEPTKTEPTA